MDAHVVWRGDRLWLAGIIALGLALRIANAETALLHDDEKTHAASDAMWSLSRLSVAEAVRFLREHPRDHPTSTRCAASSSPGPSRRDRRLLGPSGAVQLRHRTGVRGRPPRDAGGAVRTVRYVNVAADGCARAASEPRGALGAARPRDCSRPPLRSLPARVSSSSIAYFDPLLAPHGAARAHPREAVVHRGGRETRRLDRGGRFRSPDQHEGDRARVLASVPIAS
jgi:hypothetical protein